MGGWRLLLFYFIIVVVLGGWPNVEEGRTLAVRIIETGEEDDEEQDMGR